MNPTQGDRSGEAARQISWDPNRRRGDRRHEALLLYLDMLDASRRSGLTAGAPRTVREVMSMPPIAVRVDVPFKTVAETLAMERLSALPVIDPDGMVLGVVAESDLLAKAASRAAPSWRDMTERPSTVRNERARARATVAGDVMTSPAVTVNPDAPLHAAARLASTSRVRRLPVVDPTGQLVGVVSRSDLMGIFVRSDEQMRQQIISEVVKPRVGGSRTAVTTTVNNGVVTLAGRVERRSMIAPISSAAGDVDGVVQVISDLTYTMDDTREGPVAPSRP